MSDTVYYDIDRLQRSIFSIPMILTFMIRFDILTVNI